MRRKNVQSKMKLHVDNFDLKHIVLRQSEITDNFKYEELPGDGKRKPVHVADAVQVLLNQERLNETLGTTAAKNFIDSFRNQKNDPFAELRSKCSDEDLMTMVKSRHLQAPAEILAWSKYMQNNMELFTSEVQKLIEARTPPPSEVTKDPVSAESLKSE